MSIRKDRAAKGLCPDCGGEAAPYYLCDRCHTTRQVRRFLVKAESAGAVDLYRERGVRMVRSVGGAREWEAACSLRPNALDLGERGAPRMRGVPVDIQTELLRILSRAGRPVTVEEIAETWVRLRRRPDRSATAGVKALIDAEDKRARKRARNAALAASACP
jgi:hypothetical protein